MTQETKFVLREVRDEMIQVAAVAVAWADAIDRRG